MCTISINPASIVAVPVSTLGTLISVGGTITNCASNAIVVTIACPGSSVSAGAVVTGTTWAAQVDPRCLCGTHVTITATCQDTPPCTATLNTVLNCGCCPSVNTTLNLGLWNSSGQQLVTFMTALSFPTGCSVTVQRDFGDGTSGAVKTFTALPNPNPYPETHPYAPGSSYISHLNVLSHAACPPSSIQVAVTSVSPPPCVTISFLAALCKLGQALFLVFAAAASILFLALVSPLCVTATSVAGTSYLLPVASGWALTAGIALVFLYFFCRACICGFLLKMFGQLVLMVGAVLFMFVLPGNCMQPAPFANPFTALWVASLVLAIGVWAVLYATWYLTPPGFKYVCPLTICDFWQAVKDALTLAIFAAFLVFISLGTGTPVTHLGFDLLVIVLVLIPGANSQILLNQNAHNC